MRVRTMSAVLAVLLGVVSGCAGMTRSIKADAFGKTKKFALVTIFTTPKISYLEGPQGNRSISGGVAAMGKDTGYSDDSARIFAETVPGLVKRLDASPSFLLVPEAQVLQSKRYASVPADDPKIMFTTFVPYKGYRFIKDKAKMAQLAKALNVDATVVMTVSYYYTMSGVNVGGLVAAGTKRAKVILTVGAIDRNGEVVWNDNAQVASDEGISGVGESVDFQKLHPLLIQATKKAGEEILDRLEKGLAKGPAPAPKAP